MPSSGPHASLVLEQGKPGYAHKNIPGTPVVDITQARALVLARARRAASRHRIALTLKNVAVRNISPIRIMPGDGLAMQMWAQSSGEPGETPIATPKLREMGVLHVDYAGRLDVPYAGLVHVGGMSPRQAENAVARALARKRVFARMEITLRLKSSHRRNIIVMGAVNKPVVLPWRDGGIDLDEAIAEAGGYRVYDPSVQGGDLGVNNVLLIRRGREYNLPMKVALSRVVPLQPADRVVLQHRPAVRALCLGAGWNMPTMVPFDVEPTLSQVLALARGINNESAQGRAVFILKHNRRVIYRVNFDRVDGMEASQILPIEDRDMVYIPPSRSVTLRQIVGIIMTVGYPAGMGATAAY